MILIVILSPTQNTLLSVSTEIILFVPVIVGETPSLSLSLSPFGMLKCKRGARVYTSTSVTCMCVFCREKPVFTWFFYWELIKKKIKSLFILKLIEPPPPSPKHSHTRQPSSHLSYYVLVSSI